VTHAFLWRDGVMTDLGTLGGFTSAASGINDKGQVVGYSDTPTSNGELHGVLWDHGKVTDLGADFIPRSINNRGQILASNSANEVLLWEKGEIRKLADFGFGSGINERGTVAGSTGSGTLRAVLWTR
jgi:probable HAF family extracellular repeat protein